MVIYKKSRAHFFLRLLLLVVACCVELPVLMAADRKFTLVIDAGHGGRDTGAPGAFSKEKNINLSVALAFGRYVERNCPDVKVVYTRKTDVFVPLRTRAEIANKSKADVFISIHTNSVESRKPVRGMETYTMGMRRSDEKLSAAMRENEVILMENDYRQHYEGYDPRSPESLIMFELINDKNMSESIELAKLIQKHTCATANHIDKGVKQDVFLVLRETSMPACLVELGYITTPADERFLNNQGNVEALGRGIYQAFVAYKNKRMGNITVPYRPGQQPKMEQNAQQEETLSEAQPTQETMENTAEPEKKPAEPDKKPVEPEKKPAEPEKKPVEPESLPAEVAADAPVFKVQILASVEKLKPGNRQFKGLTDIDSYREGTMYKYTVGASADYNEIYRLRKSIIQKFPEAFIVAFKNGEKTDVQAAIREFKARKNKK